MAKWLVDSCNRILYSSEAEQATSPNNCGWNSQTWYLTGRSWTQVRTHWKPGMRERNKEIRHNDSVVWETRYSASLGAKGQVMEEHEGSSGRLSFHFLIWMPATWVFVNMHGLVHCWHDVQFAVSYLNKKLKHNLDTAAFNAVPGSLWQVPTAQSPFSYYFEQPHDGKWPCLTPFLRESCWAAITCGQVTGQYLIPCKGAQRMLSHKKVTKLCI